MTTYTWPDAIRPQSCTLALEANVREFVSPYTGSYDAVDLMGERWRLSMALPPRVRSQGGALEALFNKLRGVHRLAVPYYARPIPAGTLRGSPTLNASVSAGASTIVLNASSATLLAGDIIGLAGQWLQVAADAASVSTTMTVTLVNRVRAAASAGAAVTWDKPTATFRLASPVSVTHLPSVTDGVQVDLIETW